MKCWTFPFVRATTNRDTAGSASLRSWTCLPITSSERRGEEAEGDSAEERALVRRTRFDRR
jgi:hypothetical protein